MITHYVEFFYPGTMFSESSILKVKNRQSRNIKLPKNCFAFNFFDREETNSAKTKRLLMGKKYNYSKSYYIDGTIYTLNQVKKRVPNAKILIRNMQSNKWNKVIKTRFGQFQPFKKGDKNIKKEILK